MKHNLSENYFNANGSGDIEMKRDIITSEIGKLIVKYPERVIEDLAAEHFKVPPFVVYHPKTKLASKKLIPVVSHALYSSKSFAKRIADDIASGHYSFCGDGKQCNFCCASSFCSFAQDGGDGRGKVEGILGKASDLVKGIGEIFGGIKSKDKTKQAQFEAEKAKSEADKALYEKTKALSGGKKGNVGLWIGISVASAIAITVAVVVLKRK